jgi:hypothetical protein
MRGKAKILKGIRAQTRCLSHPTGAAQALGIISGSGHVTTEAGILKYLRVMPEQPQELVWLTPQVGIDYTIESNTNWNIK